MGATSKAITIDGEVRKIPVAVHLDGMVYYNKKVAAEAGIDPTKWTSLDDMWADEAKVEKIGKTFIAIGGNTFQAGYTFHALLAANAGPDVYNRFYAVKDGKIDKSVLDDPAVLSTIKLFPFTRRKLCQNRHNVKWALASPRASVGR